MQRKKRKSNLAAICIVALTVLVVVVGFSVRHRKNAIEKEAGGAFVTSSTTRGTEPLGHFDDFLPTASILYAEETVPSQSTTTYTPNSVPDTTAANQLTATIATSTATSTTTPTSTTASVSEYAYAYAGFNPQPANMSVDYTLLLVNRNYILPEDYAPTLAEAAKGTGVRMDARVAPYYQKMYDAAKADGITLTPLSGHRRISTQKTNFENKIQKYVNQGYSKAEATQMAAKIILPPGTSEHNAGIAMDILSLDVEFEQTKAFRWLQENAADYGFILRYPKDKQNITEITYEPWHWRFVGVENAKKIKASGQCLEEYLGVR